MKRRLIKIAILGTLALVLLAGGVFFLVARSGSGRIEGWIGSQIQVIANSFLNPTLSFTDLDYQYPTTVSLKNLRLTADDPARPGQKIDIIACGQAAVTLGEIPSVGKPIVISKIVLGKPLISAVAVQSNSKDFVGFSHLIRGASDSAKQETSDAPKKLSDVFRMRQVQLVDGKIVYDPRIPGTVPMALDQINTTLDIEPTNTGWYKLNTVIARKPVFELSVGGELDLDSFVARDVALKLSADLGQDKLDFIPPELQRLIKQYDAKGKLDITVTGSMPVMDPTKGEVQAQIKLDGANVAVGDFHLPVDNLDLNAKFENGKLSLPSLKIAAIGGTADLSGSATLNDRLDADLELKVSGMVLEKLLTKPTDGKSPGKLDLDFKVAGSLASIMGKVPAPLGTPLGVISLKNLRFSADDPVNPGRPIDVVACENLDVALAEPVVAGKPIVIERIILDKPVLSAVAIAPNSMQFAGIPSLPQHDGAAAPAPSPTPATSQHLSDILRVKTFQLKDATIVYDPRIPGTQRMMLDQISTSLDVNPADPSSYKLSTTIKHKSVFQLAVDGEFNLDNPAGRDVRLNLDADLTQGQVDFLPPQLQAVLNQSGAKGKLSVQVTASAPVADLARGHVTADIKLENIDVSAANARVPVESFVMSARLENGKVEIPTMRIAALQSVFDLTGSAVLNDRIDTDLKMKLNGVVIEDLLAAATPGKPRAKTSTKIDADVEIQTAAACLLGAVPIAAGGAPLASATVKNLRLTADDPITAGQSVDFVACENISVALGAPPLPGKPIVIDKIVLDRPCLRAVAIEPGSNDFAGFINLQGLAAGGEEPKQPAATSLPSPSKLSDLFRAQLIELNDASIYYDPRIPDTVPVSPDQIGAKINLESSTGRLYTFDVAIPHQPDFDLRLNGRLNIDTLDADALKLNLAVDLAKKDPMYLPPQLQQALKPYDPEGTLALEATGGLPLTRPFDGDLTLNLKLDNFKATVGDYRIPIAHVRLPAHLKDEQVELLPSSTLGGPMVEAFDGTADVAGTVTLNDRLDSTLNIKVADMLLQDFAATKTRGPAQELFGKVVANVDLVNAPLLVVAAKATPQSKEASLATRSPLYFDDLPEKWGSATVQLTEARLVGLELIQKMSNTAKAVFIDAFKHEDKDKPRVVDPKESAQLAFDLVKDRANFSAIHYEGEVVAADGHGSVYLDQRLDMDFTGGLISKLGGWIKRASDSLLYYHISGTIQDLKYEVKRGDGKPITEVIDTGVGGVKKGVNATTKGIGTVWNMITGHK